MVQTKQQEQDQEQAANPQSPTSNNTPATQSPARKGMLRLSLPENKGDLATNYRPEVEADRVAVSRAMAPSDSSLEPFVGKTIKVVGVVLNMAEFESQEVKGEMVEKVYASIVLEDGSVIGTTGKAVMGQLAYLIGAGQSGPFDPPVEFEVRTHKSPPPKKPYYSLRRVALTPKPGKTKGA